MIFPPNKHKFAPLEFGSRESEKGGSSYDWFECKQENGDAQSWTSKHLLRTNCETPKKQKAKYEHNFKAMGSVGVVHQLSPHSQWYRPLTKHTEGEPIHLVRKVRLCMFRTKNR